MPVCLYCDTVIRNPKKGQITCGKLQCIKKHRLELSRWFRRNNPKYHKEYMGRYENKGIEDKGKTGILAMGKNK